VVLTARILLAHARIVVVNLVALLGAISAMAPLMLRRRPLHHRRHLPRQVARVIPIEERRRVLRRTC
jgi:hypothetical protein